ncbi:hypothetical protein Bca101_005637 [Brassica carinata]|uniref:Myb-like domain-containing protein n=1 Tax=Brassica oleracea var. oleracea TaxID=109376 RepID=A0A0D3BFP3_BRAOL
MDLSSLRICLLWQSVSLLARSVSSFSASSSNPIRERFRFHFLSEASLPPVLGERVLHFQRLLANVSLPEWLVLCGGCNESMAHGTHSLSETLSSSSTKESDPLEPSIQLSASDASVFGSQWTEDGNEDAEIVYDRKERRKWSPAEDGVLISAWLNTSKDAVVSNEQKTIAFWKRIAAYYAASPKLAGLQKREPTHCKSRWGKINEGNENDVLKMAHKIFYNDYKARFTMEHAWLELRHDQKWCGASTTKDKFHSKRRKLDDHSVQTASSIAGSHGEDEVRPVGVKASKAKAKKSVTKSATLEEDGRELQSIWEIRQKDYAEKDRLNKQKYLTNYWP